MNRKRTSITVLVVLVLFFALTGEAWAVPPIPATFSGTVRLNGVAPGGGVNVTASIGGLSWSTTTFQAGGDTWYQIDVPGDDPDNPGKDGGEPGDTITFRVGGYSASPSGSWSSGDHLNHNLSASSPPTATPITPTSTPTNTPVPSDQYWFSGYVYDDDTGEGIGGVTVKLYRWTGAEWSEINSKTTGGGGSFGIWAAARAGQYALVEINPEGYISTRASVAPGSNGEVVDPDRIEFDNPPFGVVGPSKFYDVLSAEPTASPTGGATPTGTATPESVTPTVTPTATPGVTTTSVVITAGECGTLTSPDGSVQVTAPPGAVSEDTNLTYTWLPAELGTWFYPAGHAFRLDATTLEGDSLAGCATPVLVIIWYDPADVPPDVREEDLKLYAFDEDSGEWHELPSVTNTETDMLASIADCAGLFSAGWTCSVHLPLIFKSS